MDKEINALLMTNMVIEEYFALMLPSKEMHLGALMYCAKILTRLRKDLPKDGASAVSITKFEAQIQQLKDDLENQRVC